MNQSIITIIDKQKLDVVSESIEKAHGLPNECYLSGTYTEIESSHEKPVLVHVPNNIASAHINLSNNVSHVLALADLAWRPNDNEMVNTIFEDYDWKKLENNDN